jgi:hypothetical protein
MPNNNKLPATIPKQPVLKAAEDYYRLRREGIGFIEKMGSGLWTDYNTHDPGITILETLCYVITDLAYRIGWDMKYILAPEKASSDRRQPYPDQPFFTAKQILTVNPTSINDFRRCLIDLDKVRNSWVLPRDSACEVSYYAKCEKNELKLSYEPPDDIAVTVWPHGLYDILLELESDAEVGDLNDFKIEYPAEITEAGDSSELVIELRFPEILAEDVSLWADSIINVKLKRLATTRTGVNVLTDPSLNDGDKRDKYLHEHWHNVFYLDFNITYSNNPPLRETFTIQNIAMRIFGDAEAKKKRDIAAFFTGFFIPTTCHAIVNQYLDKLKKRKTAVDSAKQLLIAHRNLDEDYCNIKVIDIEEVAACADVEVKPNADIELVQAKIFLEIEKYFNPPVHLYTLEESLDSGAAVEDIFNGPILDYGFIKSGDLEAASFKSELYISDIMNKLMDIEGVVAINHLQLTKYDSEGNVVTGAADPGPQGYDKNKISASWQLSMTSRHQPRLYLKSSRFVFYKNGLPFYPNMYEVNDIITLLRGEVERPKIKRASDNSGDLDIPAGTFRDPEDYYPIQYSFPLTYGIGPDGLPPQASDTRKAQAMQLKGYLMVFEQLIGNAFAQLAHTADLFSLAPNVKHTYFIKEFNNEIIKNYNLIVDGLDKPTLEAIAETKTEFHERRNRFLDHIMARFGEQFDEYTFLLTNIHGKKVALDKLIDDKIDFLNSYPEISSNRARAFDYKASPCSMDNQPGLKKRIKRLLGQPNLELEWIALDDLGEKIRLKFQLVERGIPIFTGFLRVTDPGREKRDEAKLHARRAVMARMSQAENYTITEKVTESAPDTFILRLKRTAGKAHGWFIQEFDTQADAESMRDTLVAWAAFERVVVLEHLLLRPKFPGDALYPGCCDDEDPYSFRLTFMMLGWVEPYKTNMEMRNFVDRTIRQETPSHLVIKICWVDNDEFDKLEDAWYAWLDVNKGFDWTEERLSERAESILYNNLKPDETPESVKDKVSDCASNILTRWGKAFYDWMNVNVTEEQDLVDHNSLDGFIVPRIPCLNGFKRKAAVQIQELLMKRFTNYINVSYRLRIVLTLLSQLKNIYPDATLHDWAEGDEKNPIRLRKTALGS